MRNFIISLIVLSGLIHAQSQTISRPALDFTYTAPTGASIYISNEAPGSSISFIVTNPLYPNWSYYFSIYTASNYALAEADAIGFQWEQMKNYTTIDSVISVYYMQDTLLSSGIYTTSAGFNYSYKTNANIFLSNGAAYQSFVYTYFAGMATSTFLTDVNELELVKNGLVIGPVVTTIGPAPKSEVTPKDKFFSAMVDALGRKPTKSVDPIANSRLIELMKSK